MDAIACSDCFANEGLRRTMRARGVRSDAPCVRCGSSRGSRLDREALEDGAREFFVDGSILAETLAPVYQVNASNPCPAALDPTVAADAALVRELVGLVVFDYGPPLWQLGYTDHYHDVVEGDPQSAARALVRKAEAITVATGTPLHRIRRNLEMDPTVTDPATFDPPPDGVARQPGRWDDLASPVLYVSDDLELCLHECRVTLSDEIVLATLAPTRDLTLLDVSGGFGVDGPTRFQDGGLFADFMPRSRREEWLSICRAVAGAACEAGYDGVRYTSYYSFAIAEVPGLNLALFGRPLRAGLLELRSVNRVRLTTMTYGFALGPALYHDGTG